MGQVHVSNDSRCRLLSKSSFTIACVVLWLIVLVGFLNKAFAAGPVPYSREALINLNNAAGKSSLSAPPVGATKEQLIEFAVNNYKQLFSKAGYSLEKSLVQFSQDLSKDPAFPGKGPYLNTPAMLLYTISEQLNEARKDVSIKSAVEMSLSKETIAALDNIVLIEKQQIAAQKAEEEKKHQAALAEKEENIKKNEASRLKEIEVAKQQDKLDFEVKKKEMEANERIKAAEAEKRREQAKQQNEVASIEKQNALKGLSGRYELIGRKGFVDVKVISDDKVSFSLSSESGSGELCKIDNQVAALNYNTPKDIRIIFGDKDEAKTNKAACAMTLKFNDSKFGFFVEVDEHSLCRAYCQRGGLMEGKYKKTD